MIVIGSASECYGLDSLQFDYDILNPRPHRVEGILSERPETMPQLPEGYRLIAIYDRPEGDEVVICETVEDVQRLWDDHYVMDIFMLAFHSINHDVGVRESQPTPSLGQ